MSLTTTRAAGTVMLVLVLGAAIGGRTAAAAPAAPALLTPAAAASVQVPFTISWSAVIDPSGILGYNWQVSPSSSFTPVILQDSTGGQTEDIVSGLANGTYFWRVQAVSGAFEQGPWSQPRSFTITGTGPASPGVPVLQPTVGYSTFHPYELVRFNWSTVAGAATYFLQYSNDPGFPVGTVPAGIVTGGFDNITTTSTGYVHALAEGTWFVRVWAVTTDGTAGVPSNVISYSVFYRNPLPPPPTPLSPIDGPTLTLPVTLAWAHVLNPQPSGYEVQVSGSSSFSTNEAPLAVQLTDPSVTMLSLTSGTKFWRVRSHQGMSSPTTTATTAWSSTGTFTISTAPATPVSIAPFRIPLYSGDDTLVAVQLTAGVPASGATIALSSSHPAAAPVPSTIPMQGTHAWTQFPMVAGQVTAPTPVTLTATLNGGSASGQFTLLPPSLKSLTIGPSTISGGTSAGGVVMLNGQAPAGGALVSLSSSAPAASPPTVVTVPSGSYSVPFTMATTNVTTNTPVTITASWNGVSVQSQVTIAPGPVNPPAPGTPSLLSPASGASPAQPVAFDWSDVTGTASYGIQIDDSSTFETPFVLDQPTTVSQLIAPSLAVKQYWWRVRAMNAAGTAGSWSAVRSFTPQATVTTPGQRVTVTVTASGRSGERITSSPAGISVSVGSTGSASFASGTAITLSVSNGRDAIWSGACSSGGNKTKTCTFTPVSNASVTGNVR